MREPSLELIPVAYLDLKTITFKPTQSHEMVDSLSGGASHKEGVWVHEFSCLPGAHNV